MFGRLKIDYLIGTVMKERKWIRLHHIDSTQVILCPI